MSAHRASGFCNRKYGLQDAETLLHTEYHAMIKALQSSKAGDEKKQKDLTGVEQETENRGERRGKGMEASPTDNRMERPAGKVEHMKNAENEKSAERNESKTENAGPQNRVALARERKYPRRKLEAGSRRYAARVGNN